MKKPRLARLYARAALRIERGMSGGIGTSLRHAMDDLNMRDQDAVYLQAIKPVRLWARDLGYMSIWRAVQYEEPSCPQRPAHCCAVCCGCPCAARPSHDDVRVLLLCFAAVMAAQGDL